MTDQSISPVYNRPLNADTLLSFPEAIKAVKEGKKITKIEWDNENIYGVLKDGFLMLHKADGQFYQWILSDGDVIGTDFIVL